LDLESFRIPFYSFRHIPLDKLPGVARPSSLIHLVFVSGVANPYAFLELSHADLWTVFVAAVLVAGEPCSRPLIETEFALTEDLLPRIYDRLLLDCLPSGPVLRKTGCMLLVFSVHAEDSSFLRQCIQVWTF